MVTIPVPAGAGPRPRQHLARRLLVVLAVAVVMAAAFGLQYRRQVVAYLTHLKGGPDQTFPYVPFSPEDRPLLRLAVAGDVGDSGSAIDATGASMARVIDDDPFDALILLGDNVYPSGDPDRLDDTVFEPFHEVLSSGAELLAVVGNHDRGRADEQMAALGMTGRWWSREIGDVLLVGLDSTQIDDQAQRRWLLDTLASTDARWRIVAMHHPPYSSGYQGSSSAAREAFSGLFERYGVQLVLSGHDHDYQRNGPIGGVTYIVTGAASGTRRTGDADFTKMSCSWHSWVELGIYRDRMVGRAVGQDGTIADQWVLRPSTRGMPSGGSGAGPPALPRWAGGAQAGDPKAEEVRHGVGSGCSWDRAPGRDVSGLRAPGPALRGASDDPMDVARRRWGVLRVRPADQRGLVRLGD